MKGSIVGLIPVKGSSERVPNKNLREFNGQSLLEVKLNQFLVRTTFTVKLLRLPYSSLKEPKIPLKKILKVF